MKKIPDPYNTEENRSVMFQRHLNRKTVTRYNGSTPANAWVCHCLDNARQSRIEGDKLAARIWINHIKDYRSRNYKMNED